MFTRQFMAIMAKNWTINIKAKQFIRENVAVLILSVFIILSEQTNPNSFQTPFYLGIAIAGFSRTVAVWWLTEKQSHQKQLQKIMGVSQFNYIITWLIYFIMNGLIVSVVMMVIVRFLVITDQTRFADGYGFWNIAILYFFYAVSNTGYVMLVCCFFTKAKTGSQAVTFIQLIINFLYFLRFSATLTSNQALTIFLSIFPQLNFNITLSNIAFIFDPSQQISNFDIGFRQSVLTFIITTFFYVIFALYLDEVIPNEMGTHKHPLFFIGVGYQTREELHQRLISENDSENESSAKYQQNIQRTTQPVAKIINVSKSFGKKKVIDNLSLNFYQSEIFCLLGHNGAGKSTTINLLTGLLGSDQGLIEILGQSFPNDTDSIRKNIGLCLQYNVLYDNLTIQEHLMYYYRIKNQNDINMEREIEQMIIQCALNNERGKLSKNLSGGNKRKLCLANSLIGGSRLIFLDEPSSGLDPNSRQSIWAILKSISSQNRCIILTTHHLQQAEFLSNRIAIMSQGKLIIVGNKDFITDKFSVGYHVVITLNKNMPNSADIARNIIRKNINRSIQDQQAAANTVKFIFPLRQLPKFSKTLKQIEEAEIGEISIFVSNLEDAFIKIGEQQQQQFEGFKQICMHEPNQNEALNKSLEEKQLQQMKLPQVQCVYSFKTQFRAVFLRKMKTTLRSFSTVVSIIMPTGFISIGILVVCLAIPNNQTDPINKITLDRIRLFILSYFMTWAFVFNTSTYCGSVVLERQKKFKYLSNVSGMRQIPYWLGNYAFDLIVFYVPITIFFIIAFALGDSGTFVTSIASYLIIALILFGFSFIGYSYLFSFIFQKSNSAYRFFPFINLLFFYFLPLIPATINQYHGFLAQYLMPLLSPFVAFSALFNTIEVIGSDFGQTAAYSQLWVVYGALGLQAIIYPAVCFFLESLRFSLKSRNQQIFYQQQFGQNVNNQANQAIERHLENRKSQNADLPIKIQNLTKIYGNGYMAIRNNSFVVKKGQIFGLLGPNGAGKSTTFNIATAALPKTTGSVQLFNQEVNKGIMQIFSYVGVCPQYNPIYQNMTVYEHLQYFCLLKGLSSYSIQPTINFYAELLSLKPYLNVNAGVLSGGNKRKMCVGMAMIGNPNVAFFDQPSAGVDPISRRYLWKCLAASAKSKNTAMILTTHSMNEAESLCSEIGILIKGQFVCLDSPKKLKQIYGQGYRVNVSVKVQYQQQLIGLVKRYFGEDIQVQRVQNNPEFLLFIIQNSKFCLSRAFQLFEDELTTQKKIDRYEIKQSTLQQVFIHLSRLQPYVEQQQYQQPWQLLCWQWGVGTCVLTL